VREDGRIDGGEGWQENYMTGRNGRRNGKESSHSAHANGRAIEFFCIFSTIKVHKSFEK
jgi:hypothetical protein